MIKELWAIAYYEKGKPILVKASLTTKENNLKKWITENRYWLKDKDYTVLKYNLAR